MRTPLHSIRLLSVLVFITHSGSALLPSLSAHGRHIPPTPAEIAWSRTAAVVEKLRNDPRAYLPPRPPAPAGVTDLEFSEFFAPIVGDRGLELTDKIRALHGQKVRLLGFMVRQALPTPGVLLFAPQPIQVDEVEYGNCDDLPPQVVRTFVPLPAGVQVPLAAGALLLTGTLEIGQRSEIDGRNSLLRLRLDTPELTPHTRSRPVVSTNSPSAKISSQP